MARKKAPVMTGRSNRQDPMMNKSLAIRLTLAKMKDAKAAEIVDAVKKEYGHDIAVNNVYMAKTKKGVKSAKKKKAAKGTAGETTAAVKMSSASEWVEAIRAARELLRAAGSVQTAIALLKAVDG